MAGRRVKFSSIAQFYSTRNRLVMMIKNYSTINILKYIPFTVMLQLGKAIWFTQSRKPLTSVAIVRAMLDVLKDFRYIWSKHVYIQKMYVTSLTRT